VIKTGSRRNWQRGGGIEQEKVESLEFTTQEDDDLLKKFRLEPERKNFPDRRLVL
jgi:hypothetical protein